MRKLTLLGTLVLVLVLLVAVGQALGKQGPVSPQVIPEQADEPPDPTENLVVPYLDDWLASAHADVTAEAFRHWDEDDPAEVPDRCAKCHTSSGYKDYLGADGSEPGVVEAAVPVGEVVACEACHNDVTATKDSVVMPSGLELTGLGDESRCMECHQGRESKFSVDQAIADAGVEEDATSEDLHFLNIHYFAAAATKYGTLAKGGYEYDGMAYDAKFAHVDGYTTCIDCHNSHTLEVKIDGCKTCHEGVESVEDLHDVRMAGSLVDYDGDGDTEEGIYYELTGLQEKLYTALQAYAGEVLETPVIYDAGSYPYFFLDTNGNGEADEDEVAFANQYNAWSPRLLKAAYNYQTSIKDPGAYAHGGKYIIELLYDSIQDLNSALAEPAVDMSGAHRIDAGHFAGSQEAFRHWDEDGSVPGSCARCHTATGLPMYLAEGVTISQPPANGFQCATCHNDLQEFTRYTVEQVTFPSGAVIDSRDYIDVDEEDPEKKDANTNLCMTCHQGRESTVSVDKLIGDTDADATSESLRFLNVHYFAAGATRFGGEVMGGYQYEGKEYVGFYDHGGDRDVNACTDCHGAHSLEVKQESCIECHSEVEETEDVRSIRYYLTDWDGDGDNEEGVADEIATMREALYAALQEYAANTVGTGIIYSPASYPYYFTDTNGNGEADADEVNFGNRYNTWTPRLLRAAYNYQYATKDPGGFTHNAQYIIQLLYDSLEDLGADVSDMTRP